MGVDAQEFPGGLLRLDPLTVTKTELRAVDEEARPQYAVSGEGKELFLWCTKIRGAGTK